MTASQSGQPEQPCYVNRELSWLTFNRRVLEEAEREDTPLGERLAFLTIYQKNLDEFFMVRVGALKHRISLGEQARDSKTGWLPRQQLDAVLEAVRELSRRRDTVYEMVRKRLAEEGIRIAALSDLPPAQREAAETRFRREALPALSATAEAENTMSAPPDRALCAGAVLEERGARRLVILPCTGCPRLIPAGLGTYVLGEELILRFLPRIFRGSRVRERFLLRVTRSADVDAAALRPGGPETVEQWVKRRGELEPVRLEVNRTPEPETLELLLHMVGAQRCGVFVSRTPLELSFLQDIGASLRRRPDCFYPRHIPVVPEHCAAGGSWLERVLKKDLLLAYPYESMEPFLELLGEAAADVSVDSIRITLYRLARNSRVAAALTEAAKNGKAVTVLVELRARFDEMENLAWSRRLAEAGCRVLWGLPGYKVHAKLCLISRRAGQKAQLITQIGTGNYHEDTARQYTDFSLITADPAIGRGAAGVFRALARGQTPGPACAPLLAAPRSLARGLLAEIEEEIQRVRQGLPGYIAAKLNGLTDREMMEALIRASRAGVRVELIVRGPCCLLPGVPGWTEGIRIIRIVGRFLEHSRVYRFGRGAGERMYLSSADWMTRNLRRRVEVAVPVRDGEVRRRLGWMLDTMLQDSCQARQLLPDGSYVPVKTQGVDSQTLFCRQAEAARCRQRENTAPEGLFRERAAPGVPHVYQQEAFRYGRQDEGKSDQRSDYAGRTEQLD